MALVVLLVGVLISLLSLYLIWRVDKMQDLLEQVFGSPWRYAAALLRLLLGAALIASADAVAFAAAVELFGWLFVLGGLVLVAVPDAALRPMVGWFGRMSPPAARIWLSAALLFGLFFIYAALA